MNCLSTATLFRVSTPLTIPYVSSLGVTSALTSIFALVRLSDGREGCSEVTPIAGYNEETADEIWLNLNRLVPDIIGLEAQAALARVESLAVATPYSCSPIAVALETALGRVPWPIAANPDPVPLIAPVLSRRLEDIGAEIEDLLRAGYTTLKLKAGMDFERDLERFDEVRRNAGARACIRIDFNGAFDAPTAIRFIGRLDPQTIDFVEQPCAAGDWEGNLRVARSTQIATMLDESIKSIADVRRAGETGGFRFFKMKLGKFPTLASIEEAYAAGEALGMRGILGNGAATDVACRLEGLVATGHRGYAGEMNGFLKNTVQYLRRGLACRAGAVDFSADGSGSIDEDRMRRHATLISAYGDDR